MSEIAPLKVVTGSRFVANSSGGPGGSRIEELECGHTVVMKNSRPLAEQRRCWDCPKVDAFDHRAHKTAKQRARRARGR